MKVSNLQKAGFLRDKYIDLQGMRRKVEGYPRFDGFLDIDGIRIRLTHSDVDVLLTSYEEKLSDEAAEIDLEFDE